MATELMQFRIGDEYASNKLWLTYEVCTTEITVTTGDSQGIDHTLVLNEGNISQLRTWLAEVDRRMYADDVPLIEPSKTQDADDTARDGDMPLGTYATLEEAEKAFAIPTANRCPCGGIDLHRVDWAGPHWDASRDGDRG